jgi:hypothetical protein
VQEHKAEIERQSQLLSEKTMPAEVGQKSIDQRKSGGSLHSNASKPASSGLHAVKTVAFGKEAEIQTDLLMRDMNRPQ